MTVNLTLRRKEYKKPRMQVVRLKQSLQLLQSSLPDYIPEEW